MLLVDVQDNRGRKIEKSILVESFREPEVEGLSEFNQLNNDSINTKDIQMLNAMNIKEDEIANIENQRLFRNLGVQDIIMQILRLNSHLYKMEDYINLSDAIYVFLIRFCRENTANQEKLSDYIEFYVEQISESPLAIYLIREIFKDNKFFLTTKGQKTIKCIVRKEETIKISSIQKYQFFKILKTFVKCKTKIVKKNQIEILTQLTGSEDYKICSLFNTTEGLQKLKILVEIMDKADHDDYNGDQQEVKVSNEIYNII